MLYFHKSLCCFLILIIASCDNNKKQFDTPKASFSVEIGKLGQITLKNNSIHSNNFLWKFGDGSNSKEVNPVYTYKNNGNYLVQLIASNSFAKDSTITPIQISDIPTSCGENTMRILIDNKPFCSIKNYVEFQKIDFTNKTINTFLWFSSDGVYDVSKQLYYLHIQSKYSLNSKSNIDKITFGDWINRIEFIDGIGNITIVNEDSNKSITGSFNLNMQLPNSTKNLIIEGQIDKLQNQ
jgi:PKD repeat protein